MQIIAVLVISKGVSQTDVSIAHHRAEVQLDLSLLLGCPSTLNNPAPIHYRMAWLSTRSMVTRVELEGPGPTSGVLMVVP